MKKEKHEQYLPYLFLVGIVAIVAIVALVFFAGGGIEGAQIYKKMLDEFQYPCLDSDPQNDYYTAGKVAFGKIEYLDFCMEDVLHEYQCATSNSPELTRQYTCPNGCLNGVCLK